MRTQPCEAKICPLTPADSLCSVRQFRPLSDQLFHQIYTSINVPTLAIKMLRKGR